MTSKQNKVVLGLDISTAVVGVCVLDHGSGDLVLLDSVKLNKAGLEDIWDKTDAMWAYFHNVLAKRLEGLEIVRIYVEANAKVFMSGFSSANTLFLLAKFNSLTACGAYKEFGPKPTDINVRSARKALGLVIDNSDKVHSTKEKIRAAVLVAYPGLPLNKHIAKTGKSKGLEVYDADSADMIDAFVIAKSGRILVP